MKNIKKFEAFVQQSSPNRQPEVDPGVKPGRRINPSKPGPIRRDKPEVRPSPKASDKEPVKATEKDVINKFTELTNQKK
jgi:hypothetical protein